MLPLPVHTRQWPGTCRFTIDGTKLTLELESPSIGGLHLIDADNDSMPDAINWAQPTGGLRKCTEFLLESTSKLLNNVSCDWQSNNTLSVELPRIDVFDIGDTITLNKYVIYANYSELSSWAFAPASSYQLQLPSHLIHPAVELYTLSGYNLRDNPHVDVPLCASVAVVVTSTSNDGGIPGFVWDVSAISCRSFDEYGFSEPFMGDFVLAQQLRERMWGSSMSNATIRSGLKNLTFRASELEPGCIYHMTLKVIGRWGLSTTIAFAFTKLGPPSSAGWVPHCSYRCNVVTCMEPSACNAAGKCVCVKDRFGLYCERTCACSPWRSSGCDDGRTGSGNCLCNPGLYGPTCNDKLEWKETLWGPCSPCGAVNASQARPYQCGVVGSTQIVEDSLCVDDRPVPSKRLCIPLGCPCGRPDNITGGDNFTMQLACPNLASGGACKAMCLPGFLAVGEHRCYDGFFIEVPACILAGTVVKTVLGIHINFKAQLRRLPLEEMGIYMHHVVPILHDAIKEICRPVALAPEDIRIRANGRNMALSQVDMGATITLKDNSEKDFHTIYSRFATVDIVEPELRNVTNIEYLRTCKSACPVTSILKLQASLPQRTQVYIVEPLEQHGVLEPLSTSQDGTGQSGILYVIVVVCLTICAICIGCLCGLRLRRKRRYSGQMRVADSGEFRIVNSDPFAFRKSNMSAPEIQDGTSSLPVAPEFYAEPTPPELPPPLLCQVPHFSLQKKARQGAPQLDPHKSTLAERDDVEDDDEPLDSSRQNDVFVQMRRTDHPSDSSRFGDEAINRLEDLEIQDAQWMAQSLIDKYAPNTPLRCRPMSADSQHRHQRLEKHPVNRPHSAPVRRHLEHQVLVDTSQRLQSDRLGSRSPSNERIRLQYDRPPLVRPSSATSLRSRSNEKLGLQYDRSVLVRPRNATPLGCQHHEKNMFIPRVQRVAHTPDIHQQGCSRPSSAKDYIRDSSQGSENREAPFDELRHDTIRRPKSADQVLRARSSSKMLSRARHRIPEFDIVGRREPADPQYDSHRKHESGDGQRIPSKRSSRPSSAQHQTYCSQSEKPSRPSSAQQHTYRTQSSSRPNSAHLPHSLRCFDEPDYVDLDKPLQYHDSDWRDVPKSHGNKSEDGMQRHTQSSGRPSSAQQYTCSKRVLPHTYRRYEEPNNVEFGECVLRDGVESQGSNMLQLDIAQHFEHSALGTSFSEGNQHGQRMPPARSSRPSSAQQRTYDKKILLDIGLNQARISQEARERGATQRQDYRNPELDCSLEVCQNTPELMNTGCNMKVDVVPKLRRPQSAGDGRTQQHRCLQEALRPRSSGHVPSQRNGQGVRHQTWQGIVDEYKSHRNSESIDHRIMSSKRLETNETHSHSESPFKRGRALSRPQSAELGKQKRFTLYKAGTT